MATRQRPLGAALARPIITLALGAALALAGGGERLLLDDLLDESDVSLDVVSDCFLLAAGRFFAACDFDAAAAAAAAAAFRLLITDAEACNIDASISLELYKIRAFP